MKFSPTEIKLCQDIAKYWRKEIKAGDWIIPKGYSPQPTVLLSIDEKDGLHYGFMPSDEKGELYNLGYFEIKFPLLTLEDCLDFFRERKYPIALAEDKGESTCWLPWIDGKDKEFIGKPPREPCLRALLAILKEEK